MTAQVNINSCLLSGKLQTGTEKSPSGLWLNFYTHFAADHEGFLRSKQIERRKFSCKTTTRSTLSRSMGPLARFDKAKARHTEVTDLITERTARRHQIETYLKELRSREPLTEFRETDWLAMVDYITVHSKDDIRVTFKTAPRSKHNPIDAATPLNHNRLGGVFACVPLFLFLAF